MHRRREECKLTFVLSQPLYLDEMETNKYEFLSFTDFIETFARSITLKSMPPSWLPPEEDERPFAVKLAFGLHLLTTGMKVGEDAKIRKNITANGLEKLAGKDFFCRYGIEIEEEVMRSMSIGYDTAASCTVQGRNTIMKGRWKKVQDAVFKKEVKGLTTTMVAADFSRQIFTPRPPSTPAPIEPSSSLRRPTTRTIAQIVS